MFMLRMRNHVAIQVITDVSKKLLPQTSGLQCFTKYLLYQYVLTIKFVDLNKPRIDTMHLPIFRWRIGVEKVWFELFCETGVLRDHPEMKFSNPNTLECRSLVVNVNKFRRIVFVSKYVYQVQTDRQTNTTYSLQDYTLHFAKNNGQKAHILI